MHPSDVAAPPNVPVDVGCKASGNVSLGAEDDEEDHIVAQWDVFEEIEPADPYRVLGAERNAGPERIEELFSSKVAACCPNGNEPTRGGGRVLMLRARRAFEQLRDSERRHTVDVRRKERIDSESWAKLQYANGFYEGGVTPESMQENHEPIRQGKGVTVLVTGEKYEGAYHADMRQGIGLQFWQNGDLYIGQWEDDQMWGKGCYFYGTGQQYTGAFEEGRRHGDGQLVWPDGSVYRGQFDLGHRTGHGVLELPKAEGSNKATGICQGEWKNGHLQGMGSYASEREGRYEGNFRNSKFHGKGRLELPNGDVYEGSFVNGQREGDGRYSWANGDVYEGHMRANKRDGHGRFASLSRRFEFGGMWQNDMPQGWGCMRQEVDDGEGISGFEYKGMWDRGLKEGDGCVVWPNGSTYSGRFTGNKQQGAGKLQWPSGCTWEGSFARDLRHGTGVLHRPMDADNPAVDTIEVYQKGLLIHNEEDD